MQLPDAIRFVRRLRDVCDRLRKSRGTVAIIGGGFLGSELAVSLVKNHNQPDASGLHTMESEFPVLKVLHVFRESAPLGQVLPPCLAAATGRYEASCGAELFPSSEVVSVSTVPSATPTPLPESETTGKPTFANPLHTVAASDVPSSPQRICLRIRRNEPGREGVEEIVVDHVVCVVGIEPNTDLAASAGLEVDPVHGGFLVNAELETRAGVYVAGDAASYWDPVLGFRRRVEHLNFAEETGQLAGKNMAASLQPSGVDSTSIQRYHYQSSLWSSLGPNLSWDAVGNVDARRLETRSFFLAESPAVKSDDQSSSAPAPDALQSIPASDFGRLGRGVVFYLTPKEKRLVGVLLWNLPDELYTDEKYAAPGRLNLARSLLAQRRLIGQNPEFRSAEDELRDLASQFDLGGELERDYAELKAYMEAQMKDSQEDPLSKSDNPVAEQTSPSADS
ncbi:unnamed protein product [Echinostoma caproni]|uniref:Pyr_redox_2 domain-containing protein n=1 Tax=Echinostoma caproni TaxID=27848 RepID=A0A183B0F3_9TREM|nr:unnamed protein product [Echinostoma caproni]